MRKSEDYEKWLIKTDFRTNMYIVKLWAELIAGILFVVALVMIIYKLGQL